jgi:osmoprotectant transport system permease protein
MILLWEKILEQLYLVSLSMLTAVVIGLLLGVLLKNSQKWQIIVLGAINVIQTIPSLALLALLLPILGIGFKPAFIVLTLYAILPIVRNTLVGLSEVSHKYIEVAQDLGASYWQCLLKIELPLALPMIISGIRIAIAMTVGIATIAAFIGAGGLGDFITRGLAMNDNKLLLMGAIPAGLMALGLDGIFGYLQFKNKNHQSLKLFILGISLTIFGLLYFGYHQYFKNPAYPTITIGTKSFTEQYILGEITAQLIEAKTPLIVVRKFNLGTTDICMKALQRGDIDIYPEYTGTAYMTVLHLNFEPGLTSSQLYQIVKKNYHDRYYIKWLGLLGFDNSQALVVQDKYAKKYHVKTLSDLSLLSSQLVLGAPPEFIDRSDGYPILKKNYEMKFAQVIAIEPILAYQALNDNRVDAILAFTTDPRIKKFHLQVLEDNKKVFPTYHAALLINEATLTKYPDLEKILNLLDNKINTTTMQNLNEEVDIQKMSIKEVAHKFLVEKKLVNSQ